MILRNLKYILLPALLTLSILTSCTHNNGDIGIWFGSWKVESITVDGTNVADYKGNIFFMFQSNVFNMREVDETLHERIDEFANWEDNDATITINYSDNLYAPFAITGLERESTLTVEQKKSKHIVLSYVNPTTKHVYHYMLTRWS
jgi:hypothetical protein